MADTVVTAGAVASGNTPRKALWRSRKFWLAVLASLIPVLNEALGLHLTPETVTKAYSTLLGLIGVEAVADLVKVHHEAKARASG